MGVAGSAPGYSIAVTLAVLIGTAGLLSPGALVIFAVPMLGIALAYKALNRREAHAGAAYQWTTRAFGKLAGFYSGWALLVASMVFMVAGSVPLATATLDFFDPALAGNVTLTTLIASGWFVAIGLVLIAGIEITSKLQVAMTSVEVLILTVVLVAAFLHASHAGLANAFSWSWFGFGYSAKSFAASALVVVFFYWGWDVTANLGEETKDAQANAGHGGVVSVIVTIIFYFGFTLAALFLFSLKDAQNYSDNIIYHLALTAGLGRAGALLATGAVILSSVATLETTMLQFSRTLFAMGRDGAMPTYFGVIGAKTLTPVRAMLLLLGMGLVLLWLSNFLPTVRMVIDDSVKAVGILVAYYFGLAGCVAGWEFRKLLHQSPWRWFWLSLFPALSGLSLIVLGIYAMTTFDIVTNIVGLGGLAAGIVFFRPHRTASIAPVLAE